MQFANTDANANQLSVITTDVSDWSSAFMCTEIILECANVIK